MEFFDFVGSIFGTVFDFIASIFNGELFDSLGNLFDNVYGFAFGFERGVVNPGIPDINIDCTYDTQSQCLNGLNASRSTPLTTAQIIFSTNPCTCLPKF